MPSAPAVRTPVPAALAFCIVPVLFHLAIVAMAHIRLSLVPTLAGLFKLGFVTASALAHWGIYGSLLVTFALTLRPGREALITAMARRLHHMVPDDLAIYTRRVTIAWCGFFAAQLATSVALFCFAPLVVWSFFVNILDIPLVAAMFAAEYVVRLRVLRNPPRHSLAVIMNMIADARKPIEEPAGLL
jgi:uncharacterized membrane protein